MDVNHKLVGSRDLKHLMSSSYFVGGGVWIARRCSIEIGIYESCTLLQGSLVAN